jgi:hypothetical protein
MWFLVGLIVGIGILALIICLRHNHIPAKWYEWVIGLGGLALLLFAIQKYYGSQSEFDVFGASGPDSNGRRLAAYLQACLSQP